MNTMNYVVLICDQDQSFRAVGPCTQPQALDYAIQIALEEVHERKINGGHLDWLALIELTPFRNQSTNA